MSKIMIVDDENDIIELLRFVLEREGHQVFSAYNGKEALEKVLTVNPDLIISDIMMPEMDGYTMNTRLQAMDETRQIPVIILTAKGQMRDLFVLGANVVSFMEKPFDPKSLRDHIKQALENK